MLYSDSSPTVIFVPGYAYDAEGRDTLALETVLTHRMYNFISRFKVQDVVGVKSCECEPTRAACYAEAFVQVLQRNEQSGFLCGTSNRHLDESSNAVVDAQRVLERQTSREEVAPYVALDGLTGEHEISSKTNRCLDKDVYLAGELPYLDGVISVSCFMSSGEGNAGGAIVNLGQGLASKKGKILQHTTHCPQVNVTKCYQCRRCVRLCPTRAIHIADGHAVIDARKCIKCGKCVETAHYGGITYDWNATAQHYDETVVRHAQGVLGVLEDKVICINIVIRDNGDNGFFVGGMISSDPVALDCAAIDLCEQQSLLPTEKIQRMRDRLTIAQAAGLGTLAYDMETVAY